MLWIHTSNGDNLSQFKWNSYKTNKDETFKRSTAVGNWIRASRDRAFVENHCTLWRNKNAQVEWANTNQTKIEPMLSPWFDRSRSGNLSNIIFTSYLLVSLRSYGDVYVSEHIKLLSMINTLLFSIHKYICRRKIWRKYTTIQQNLI